MEGPTKSEHGRSKFSHIIEQIEKMVEEDQIMRGGSISGEVEWDEELDRKNTEAMKDIVAQIGWPTISRVGKDASFSAWLLVQHADHDPEFQEKCLELMKQEPESEVDPKNIAYLEDRVRVNTGRGQLYGTQFSETMNDRDEVIGYEPRSIEDEDRVDERRSTVGLEPFEEYKRALTQKYYPHLLDKE